MPAGDAAALVERLLDPTVPELRVSFSAGISECGGGEVAQDAIARADNALYEAKRTGRGRTVVHGRGA